MSSTGLPDEQQGRDDTAADSRISGLTAPAPGPASPVEPRFSSRREARAAEAAAEAGVTSGAASGAGDVAPTPGAAGEASTAAVAPVRPAARRSVAARRPSAHAYVAPRPTVDPAPARSTGAASGRPSLSRRALGFATFSVVGGLVTTTALPAYSARRAARDTAGGAARAQVQNLTVSADATPGTVVRDSFAAPTQAQLDEAKRQAAVLSASDGGSFSTVQTRAVGDDYPWPNETIDDDGGGLSPLGYYYRECVDFVAWRLNRDAGASAAPWKYTWGLITPLGGSAWEWPDNWAAKGWATSRVPIVGCVAWWTYNHVSYVQDIGDDGTVLLEEYNYGGKHSYVTRTFPTAQVPLFLYPPSV